MAHRQDPTPRDADDRPPVGARDQRAPRATRPGRRPWSVLLTGANALAAAAVVAVLVLALALVLRGSGRSLGSTQPAPSSACALPKKPAKPTGRDVSLFVPCMFEREPSLRRADEAGLVLHPGTSQTVSGFTLTVQRFYANTNRIVVGYTIAGPDYLEHRPFAGGLTITDSAGRTYQEDGRYRSGYGGFGPERVDAYIAGFDASGRPPVGGEETFHLRFVARPGHPERVGTAGPWEITLSAPVSAARSAGE